MLRDDACQRHWLGDLWQSQNAALLYSFDGIRPHTIRVDARHLAMVREHRLQARDAHLHRLLHRVVEPRSLQRREQIVQVGGFGLRSSSTADVQDG